MASSAIWNGDTLALRQGYTSLLQMRTVLAGRRGFVMRASLSTVTARIDHGVWVADCPYCAGAEPVSLTHRTFFCLSCGMLNGLSRWRVVVFPADIAATEALVAELPPSERNWRS